MIKNYFKIALRNLLKQKAYSLINITGLAIGIAVSLLILLWVLDEISFDKFNENYKTISLIYEKQYYSDQKVFSVSATPYPLGPALKEEYPEVIRSTRFDSYSGQKTKFEFGENKFNENIVFVDPDFTDMFSFKPLEGDLAGALDNPNSIVLTKSIAKKYFGDENPIGKILKAENKYDFIVTAVLEDCPANSSLQFELLGNMEFLKTLGKNTDNWGNNSTNTYIQLAKNVNASVFAKKIQDRVKEYQSTVGTELFLHPLSKLHLYSREGVNSPGRIQNVIIFGIIALFILIIASINFINLSTARATKRFKEIGLKKVIGATRSQLARQFFGESVLLSIFGLVLALVTVILLLPEFNFITGKEITIAYFSLDFYLLATGITIFVGIVSGLYPSLYLSKFTPIQILNERGKGKASSTVLRTVLVVFQFAISVVLILATVVLYKQTDFLLNKDVGYSKENVVYIQANGEMKDKMEVLKSRLSSLTSLETVASGLHLPAMIGWNGGGYNWEGKPPKTDPLVSVTYSDNNWWKVFDMKIVAGRGFNDEMDKLGSPKVMINETFAKMIQSDGNVVGKILNRGGDDNYTIIGVIKDFDFLNLRREVGPLAIFNHPVDNFLFAKIKPSHEKDASTQIEKVINNTITGIPPTITYLEDYLNNRFVNEKREQTLAGYFSLLTIIIAALGLVGLSSFIAGQKTREIGIRKILGAAVSSIVSRMSFGFLKWILIANLIGLPIGYYLMNRWLENYPYRIGVDLNILLTTFFASVVIALLSTGFQSVKAAMANPVDSLRYE